MQSGMSALLLGLNPGICVFFYSDRGYSNEPYLLPHGLKATAICYLSSNMSQLNEKPISCGVCVCLCASESARDKPIPVHKSLQGALL